jgi:hypothetical protein
MQRLNGYWPVTADHEHCIGNPARSPPFGIPQSGDEIVHLGASENLKF